MVAIPRNRLFNCLAVLLGLLAPVEIAQAGWVTIKNDANRVIILQSSVPANGKLKHGKPMRLLPGESIREFVQPDEMLLEVYDAKSSKKPILTANLAIKNEKQNFSVSMGSNGAVVSPVPSK
ncbi:MAG TPA: hypothetical protein VGL71_07015 [Urbifossiella sp.]|jgi:fructose-specific component phosphotransferase system IIB-like protein